MPRTPLIRTSHFPYHVTARSNNKEWFYLPLQELWRICTASLRAAHEKYAVKIISFVLMTNHDHLILETPDANLDSFMYELNKRVSKEVRKKSDRINLIFGGRYKWCIINSERYFFNCYRYVYQNPLRAGLVSQGEAYPYSTLRYKIEGRDFGLELHPDFQNVSPQELSWINAPISEEEASAVRKGLRKKTLTTLKSNKRNNNRRPL